MKKQLNIFILRNCLFDGGKIKIVSDIERETPSDEKSHLRRKKQNKIELHYLIHF